MSHHHRDTEKQMSTEQTLHRRHSHHGHSHLRAAGSVIDHLKTKVKRKRISKHGSAELSDTTSNQSENINNNSNIQHSVEPTHHQSTTAGNLHPMVLPTIFSFDGNDDTELNSNNGMFSRKLIE
jgi:hypothetical protein